MKRLFVLLFTNIFVISILFILLDFCYAYFDYSQYINTIQKTAIKEYGEKYTPDKLPVFGYSLKHPKFVTYYDKKIALEKTLRKSKNNYDKNKKSIIVMGCSFAEGAFLDLSETLSAQLNKYSGRISYNMGFSSSGPAEMLFLTKYKNFYKKIDKTAEYVIYIIIPDHFRRAHFSSYGICAKSNIPHVGYKIVNNKFKEYNPVLGQLCRFYIVRKIFNKYIKYEKNKSFDFTKAHLIEAKKELQKQYPDIKFIILKHPHLNYPEDSIEYYLYNTERWQELKEEGFIVIDLPEFIGENIQTGKYMLADKHPNAKLWEITAKKLTKEFNL